MQLPDQPRATLHYKADAAHLRNVMATLASAVSGRHDTAGGLNWAPDAACLAYSSRPSMDGVQFSYRNMVLSASGAPRSRPAHAGQPKLQNPNSTPLAVLHYKPTGAASAADNSDCGVTQLMEHVPSAMDNTTAETSPNEQDGSRRRKGGQVRFTFDQLLALERKFLSKKYLTARERQQVARKLALSERQVKTWFQNRRAKWRRVSSGNETANASRSK